MRTFDLPSLIGSFGEKLGLRRRPAPTAEAREAGAWFYCVAGPDREGPWLFDLLCVDASNFARRWRGTIHPRNLRPAHRRTDWPKAISTFLHEFEMGDPFEVPAFPVIFLADGSPSGIDWHRCSYTVGEFEQGSLLIGLVTSEALRKRFDPPDWTRAADRVRLSKPGAVVGSKVFARMFEVRNAVTARKLAEYWPWTCHLGPAEFAALIRALRKTEGGFSHEQIASAMSVEGPFQVTTSAIRRYDQLPSPVRGDVSDDRILIDILSSIPASWLAMSDEDLVFLSRSAKVLDRVSPLLASEIESLFSGSKGEIVPFLKRATGKETPEEVARVIGDVFDLLEFVATEIVGAVASVRPRMSREPRPVVLSIARQVISPDGNLAHLVRKSERWHANVALFPYCLSVNGSVPWAGIGPDVEIDGVRVTSVTRSEDLTEHGRQMDNCLRGYRRRCETGAANVVALTEGSVTRSVAEIDVDEQGGATIVQHRGVRNEEPSERDRAILREWESMVSDGRLVLTPRERMTHPRPSLFRYDFPREGPVVWRGLIQGRLTDLGWDQFCDEVFEIARERRRLSFRRRIPALPPEEDET